MNIVLVTQGAGCTGAQACNVAACADAWYCFEPDQYVKMDVGALS